MPEIISAGLLMYALNDGQLKIFLVHPGGPFFINRDEKVWSIPKGLIEDKEEYLDAAIREFKEETGITPPDGDYYQLGSVKQKSGKTVYAWAFKTLNTNPGEIKSNTFKLEWPPHSGKIQNFPEIDKGEFFPTETAIKKINPSQIEFISRLKKYLNL